MQHSDDPRSHLFTVRIWTTDIGEGELEWRGRVQLLPDGEVTYFRDWNTLIALLQSPFHAGCTDFPTDTEEKN